MALWIPIIALSIPLFAIAAWIATDWMRLQEKKVEAVSSETAEKAAQYAAKIERLEQRVAVLERILTDRSTVLADEIDRLRDLPIN